MYSKEQQRVVKTSDGIEVSMDRELLVVAFRIFFQNIGPEIGLNKTYAGDVELEWDAKNAGETKDKAWTQNTVYFKKENYTLTKNLRVTVEEKFMDIMDRENAEVYYIDCNEQSQWKYLTSVQLSYKVGSKSSKCQEVDCRDFDVDSIATLTDKVITEGTLAMCKSEANDTALVQCMSGSWVGNVTNGGLFENCISGAKATGPLLLTSMLAMIAAKLCLSKTITSA